MVLYKDRAGKETTLLFPITSQRPPVHTLAVEIPQIEARRARLYSPAWIIVSEFNSDDLAKSIALEEREPLGTFIGKFMAMVAAKAAAAMRAVSVAENLEGAPPIPVVPPEMMAVLCARRLGMMGLP